MKRLTNILVWPWPLWSCLLSGTIARIINLPEIWGGNNVFVSYAIPFPVASGTFHLPMLFTTTLLLYFHAVIKDKWTTWILLTLSVLSILIITYIAKIMQDDILAKQLFVWTTIDPTVATIIAIIIKRKEAQQERIR